MNPDAGAASTNLSQAFQLSDRDESGDAGAEIIFSSVGQDEEAPRPDMI
jgi:hypothetical protein